MMLFLWKEASGNKNATEFFQKWEKQLLAIHERLGDRSSFSQDLSGLQNVPMSICQTTLVPMDDTVMQKHWNWVRTAAVS